MRKREELTNPAACMFRAHDDEPTFVLLARDAAAPAAIRVWAAERVRLGLNLSTDRQMVEANETADLMEQVGAEFKRRPLTVQSGADLIARERERQKAKGYTAEHDDEHEDSSLLLAGMLLLVEETGHSLRNCEPPMYGGPWQDGFVLDVMNKYKGNGIGRLVIAGAMIAAEIDRQIRDAQRRLTDDARTDLTTPE